MSLFKQEVNCSLCAEIEGKRRDYFQISMKPSSASFARMVSKGDSKLKYASPLAYPETENQMSFSEGTEIRKVTVSSASGINAWTKQERESFEKF